MPVNLAYREELERQIEEHNFRKKKRSYIVPKIGGSPAPPTPPEADYFFQTPYTAKSPQPAVAAQRNFVPPVVERPLHSPEPDVYAQPPRSGASPLMHPAAQANDFMQLDSKLEQERRKKDDDRRKAEELRAALEEQISMKNKIQKQRREAELREAREDELAFQRRAELESKRRAEKQERQARAIVELQEENRSLAQNHSSSGKSAPSPLPTLQDEGMSAPPQSPSPISFLKADNFATDQIALRADVTAADQARGTSTADLRDVLNRIHAELMQQRQAMMSPTGYAMGWAPARLPPLQQKPAAPPTNQLPNKKGELVTDTAFVGNRRDDIFSMTSANHNHSNTNVSPTRLPRNNMFEIHSCLKRNHERLQRLQFARNTDDVLKVFLSHDAPLGATRPNPDLMPPSSL